MNLGLVLAKQPGREAEAEAAFSRGAEAGDTGAWYELGWLMAEQPGREEEAEGAYRRGDERGHAEAANNLGNMLGDRGDVVGAEAANNLGRLLEARGHPAGAEAAYRRGDDRGSAIAAVNLGFLLNVRGDLEVPRRPTAVALRAARAWPPTASVPCASARVRGGAEAAWRAAIDGAPRAENSPWRRSSSAIFWPGGATWQVRASPTKGRSRS